MNLAQQITSTLRHNATPRLRPHRDHELREILTKVIQIDMENKTSTKPLPITVSSSDLIDLITALIELPA